MQRYALTIIALALLTFYSARAQPSRSGSAPNPVDSLERRLRLLEMRKPDSVRVNLLCRIATELKNNQPRLALNYARTAGQLADSLQYAHGRAEASLIMGDTWQLLGEYGDALEFLFEAQRGFETEADTLYLALTLQRIGSVYLYLPDYAQAMEYYTRALTLYQSKKQQLQAARTEVAMGEALFQRKMYLHALEYYLRAQEVALQTRDDRLLASCWVNISESYRMQGKQGRALEYALKALPTVEWLNDKYLRAQTYNIVGAAYFNTGNYDLAKLYASKGLATAEAVGARRVMREAAAILSEVYAAQGLFLLAYQNQRTVVALADSLRNDETRKRVAVIQFSIQLEKKQRESDLQNRDKTIQELSSSRQVLILVAISVFIMLLAGGVFALLYIRNRMGREEQLQNLVRATPVPLMVMQTQGRIILQTNSRFKDAFGYSQEDTIGKSAQNLLFDDETFERLRALIRPNNGIVKNVEVEVLCRDGSKLWVLLSTGPVVFNNEQALCVGFADITERRKNEEALKEAKHELEVAFHELQATRSQLQLSEKLALLGQLVAGIAHEINTPLSATKASAETLREIVPRAIANLRSLLFDLTPEQAELVQVILSRPEQPQIQLTTREERAYRRELEMRLNQLDLPNAESIAARLSEINYTGTLQELAPLLVSQKAEAILEVLYRIGQMQLSLNNISLASGKIQNLVLALKRYTHASTPEALEPVYLLESLNTILVLYSYQIRQRVSLITQFEANLCVKANSDKLGQVWTNIITNALQAMPIGGTLKVELLHHLEGERAWALIQITDNGKGISEDVLPLIFEPFFTTKPKGEGSGLGLDICRKIIRSYGGEIHVKSKPGQTTFAIHLPVYTDIAASSR